MRDKTHNEQIERWARYVKENPNWKKEQKLFLDSQLINSKNKFKKILSLPDGENKLKRIRNLN